MGSGSDSPPDVENIKKNHTIQIYSLSTNFNSYSRPKFRFPNKIFPKIFHFFQKAFVEISIKLMQNENEFSDIGPLFFTDIKRRRVCKKRIAKFAENLENRELRVE